MDAWHPLVAAKIRRASPALANRNFHELVPLALFLHIGVRQSVCRQRVAQNPIHQFRFPFDELFIIEKSLSISDEDVNEARPIPKENNL